jgi:uncharacterized membrane protein
MTLLVLGLTLFLGIHLLPSVPVWREVLVARLGAKAYRGLFALVSFLGFGLIIYGKSHAPYVHGFFPPPWGRHLTLTLMLLSAIALAAIYLPTNLKRFTPHPMLWSTTLWAGAHLCANGDVASLLLFGSFLGFGLFDIWSCNRRGALPKKERVPLVKDLLVVGLGLISYGVLIVLHPLVIGVPVF